MKNLTYASSITIAAVLVGCGGSQMPQSYVGTPMASHQQMPQLRQPAFNYAFDAHYKGSIARVGGCQGNHHYELIDFLGKGGARFLHRSDEFGSVLVKKDVSGCDPVEGYFDLISYDNQKDSITLFVRFSQDWKAKYEVIRGTGRYAGATGNGTASFVLTSDHYDDEWLGQLDF